MSFYIIDAHMHPFIDANAHICAYPLNVTPSEIGADLTRCGIDAFAGSVITRTVSSFDDIRQANDAALTLRAMYGSRYIPGVHIHPRWVRESCEELNRLYNVGVRYIGELVPYIMDWASADGITPDGKVYSAPQSLEILSVARDLGFTLSIHPSNHEDMDALCAALPDLPVIIAHPGEKANYLRNLDRLEKYPNAYLDICGTGLFRNRMLWYGVQRVGAERFLFGTDYPVCNPAMQVAAVEYERLTDRERELIFAGNFQRLLGK